jgi:hypothetical protein
MAAMKVKIKEFVLDLEVKGRSEIREQCPDLHVILVIS